MRTDIRHIVKIKPEYVKEFKNTTIENGKFAGVIIIEGQDTCVFKILPSECTIMIPYDYILWMAPAKIDTSAYYAWKKFDYTT